MPRQLNEIIVQSRDIQKIGKAIGGIHWQADLARQIGCSKSFLTRAVDGTRAPDEDFLLRFRAAMADRITEIAPLFETEGLPLADDPETKKVTKKLQEVVEILQHQNQQQQEKQEQARLEQEREQRALEKKKEKLRLAREKEQRAREKEELRLEREKEQRRAEKKRQKASKQRPLKKAA